MRVRWVLEDERRPGGVESVVRVLDDGLRAHEIDSRVHSWLGRTPAQDHQTGALQWVGSKIRVARAREIAARTAAAAIKREICETSDVLFVLDPGSFDVARHLVGSPRWGLHIHWSPDLILSPERFVAGDEIPRAIAPLVMARARATGRSNERLVRAAPFVVAITRSHAQTLRVLRKEVLQVANPVNAGPVTRRAPLGVGDVVNIGFVGRLAWEKGPDLFLEAVARLSPAVGETRAIVAGAGAAEADMWRRARVLGLDKIEFLGWVADVRRVLDRVNVLVLPSRTEALGLVLVEAISAGCVVVAADAGTGVRDVLRDGDLGAIVPLNDPAALALSIEAAVRHAREGRFPPMEKVFELVEEHGQERIVEQWIDLLTNQQYS